MRFGAQGLELRTLSQEALELRRVSTEYGLLKASMKKTGIPCFFCPGNHPAQLAQVCGNAQSN